MNTLPLRHHIELARTVSPSLRWDGVTPMDQHRAACEATLRDLLGMDTFTPCEPLFEITAEDTLHGHPYDKWSVPDPPCGSAYFHRRSRSKAVHQYNRLW